MSNRSLVTAHALVRWLERIERRDLSAVRAAMRRAGVPDEDDGGLLDFLRVYEGFDVAAARRRMLTPAVRMAIDRGACSVLSSRARLIIQSGVIATVVALEKPRARRFGERREARRAANAWARSLAHDF